MSVGTERVAETCSSATGEVWVAALEQISAHRPEVGQRSMRGPPLRSPFQLEFTNVHRHEEKHSFQLLSSPYGEGREQLAPQASNTIRQR